MKLDALLSFTMALLTLVLISAAAFGADGELALVRDGASAFTVVHAADAPASVRTAARELREYVEKATRARLPIVEGAAPAGTACISLGDTALARAAGIDTTGVPLEGFRLVSRGGHLFILGPDTRDGVCTFLEEFLDVRWLLPGPLGEDVPPLDCTVKPGFFNRTVSGMQIERPAVKEWSARQKLGGSVRLEHNHAWHRVVPPAPDAEAVCDEFYRRAYGAVAGAKMRELSVRSTRAPLARRAEVRRAARHGKPPFGESMQADPWFRGARTRAQRAAKFVLAVTGSGPLPVG